MSTVFLPVGSHFSSSWLEAKGIQNGGFDESR